MYVSLLPLLIALCGCQHAIVLLDDTGPATVSGDTDTDTDSDTDSDSDSDSDSDTGTVPTPAADFASFVGSQRFTYSSWTGDCDETVEVVGTEVSPSSDTWAAAADACPSCDDFYDVTYSTSTACSWISLPAYVHGVRFLDTVAESTVLEANYSGGYDVYAQDLTGTFDGFTFDYDVTISLYGLDVRVEGDGTFPEL